MSLNDELDELERTTIPRVIVQHGHDSEETAFFQDDYPNGRLRCHRRVWRERGTAGPEQFMWRFAARTSNPRQNNETWSKKPSTSTYSELLVLYTLPGHPDHIRAWTASQYIRPADIHRARLMGIVEQLTRADRAQWRRLLRQSRGSRTMWQEWNRRLDAMTSWLTEHADVPEMPNSVWTPPGGQPMHIDPRDVSVLEAVARERLATWEEPSGRVHVTPAGWVITQEQPSREGAVRRVGAPPDSAVPWKADLRLTAVFPADSRDAVPDEVMGDTQAWLDAGAPDAGDDAQVHQRVATLPGGWALTLDRTTGQGVVTDPDGNDRHYGIDETGDFHPLLSDVSKEFVSTLVGWLRDGAPIVRPEPKPETDAEQTDTGTREEA